MVTMELTEHIEQLNLINRMARAINMLTPLDDLLTQFAQFIRQSSGYDAVFIGLVEWGTAVLHLCAASVAEQVALPMNSE